MACAKGFIALIVCGSFFLACVVTIACTGALVAAPSYWAQGFQKTTCIAITSTYVGSRTCTCGGNGRSRCDSRFPCYRIEVKFTVDGNSPEEYYEATIYDDETLGINKEECSYIPGCNTNGNVNIERVGGYLAVFGKPGANYSCFYNPENPSEVIVSRLFSDGEVIASLVVPGVFLGLFGIATMAAAYVWCANK